jgi:hypothetical protein
MDRGSPNGDSVGDELAAPLVGQQVDGERVARADRCAGGKRCDADGIG